MAATQKGERLTDRYQATLAALSRHLAVVMGAAWMRLPGTNEAASQRWLRTAVPIVLGAQARAVAVTDAYLAAFLSVELGHRVPTQGLSPATIIGVRARRGTPLESVYNRPLAAARHAQRGGASLRDALAEHRGWTRAAAATDVQLAARSARAMWSEGSGEIRGWRRSLGGGKHCALCASVAGNVYRSPDLMPLHAECNCVTEPVVIGRRQRPPRKAAIEDSPAIQDAAANGRRVATTAQHDELGPVLVAR